LHLTGADGVIERTPPEISNLIFFHGAVPTGKMKLNADYAVEAA
jgi:hypothetical protein